MNIEHGIPVPPSRASRVFPWPDMRAGDSLRFTGADAFRRTDSALASFRQYRTRHKIRGMRLIRRTDEDGSVRIWMQKTPAKKGGKR